MPSRESAQIRATFVQQEQVPDQPVEVGRREWEAAVAETPLPPGIETTSVDVGGISGMWVRSGAIASQYMLFWLHGGGFNAGSCVTHRELGARLALASGVDVLLIDYRLAPEHPFPEGLEDCVAAYHWLLQRGTDANAIIIGGDSAGAGLAVATLLLLRDNGVALPAGAVLLSPWLDLALSGSTMQTHAAIDPLTTRRGLQRAADWYLNGGDPRQPLASPLYGDLHGLPPLLIQVGDHELLLSDATRFAERAQAAGVAVSLEIWDAMWHVWHGWADVLPEGQQAIDDVGTFVQQRLRKDV